VPTPQPTEPATQRTKPAPLPTELAPQTHLPIASNDPPTQLPTHSMITRSRTGSLCPNDFSYFQLFHTSLHDIEPASYHKVVTDPRWKEAMQLEYDALISNGTCSLYHKPKHHNIICNKWVFKIKMKVWWHCGEIQSKVGG
jgi:hypothetical protein